MHNLFFCRHGEQDNDKLTQSGITAIKNQKKSLSERGVILTTGFSSIAPRCIATTEILTESPPRFIHGLHVFGNQTSVVFSIGSSFDPQSFDADEFASKVLEEILMKLSKSPNDASASVVTHDSFAVNLARLYQKYRRGNDEQSAQLVPKRPLQQGEGILVKNDGLAYFLSL